MRNNGPLAFLMLVGLACASAKPNVSPRARSPAVAVVQSQLDAYNKQDLEAFVSTYADDVVVTSGGKVVSTGVRQRTGAPMNLRAAALTGLLVVALRLMRLPARRERSPSKRRTGFKPV